jgi:lipoate-protein ligase A
MTTLPVASGQPPASMRWIPPCCLEGAWQMAIDAWLLDRLAIEPQRAGPMLRLYRWSRPTLSLGWHQQRLEPHWRALFEQGRIDLVRRPSGGRAVLHGGDLTYALVWPQPAGSRRQVYGRALEWLTRAFLAMGQPLQAGRQSTSLQPSSCFATNTLADLVQDDGAKRIGSAQLWRHGHLLQHGSIQLDPSPSLWRAVFVTDPPSLQPLPLSGPALEAHLYRSAARWLPVCAAAPRAPLTFSPLTMAELAAIAPLLGHYRLDGSASGLTSPEVTMPRAT